jgi:hypothetical protein
MKYQDCVQALQADEETAEATEALAGGAHRLGAANINPATGLASDYLNHFNEAIMLLEILPSCPDCRDDFLAWRAKSYAEHFAGSHFKDRALAIAAYATADAHARQCLDALAGTMTAVLEATRTALAAELPAPAAATLAEGVAARLRPLIVRAGAVINGDPDTGDPPAPQAIVDTLMKQ